MRYASIRSFDISNGEGIGVALFTQGCHFHCKGCFNQETWDLAGGKEYNLEVEDHIMELLSRDFIDRFSILGGEPLLERNIVPITLLCKKIKKKYPDKKIWLYTGYDYDYIKDKLTDLFENVDVVVDGTYKEELRDLNLHFRGSSNQRVIDVKTGKLLY